MMTNKIQPGKIYLDDLRDSYFIPIKKKKHIDGDYIWEYIGMSDKQTCFTSSPGSCYLDSYVKTRPLYEGDTHELSIFIISVFTTIRYG